MTRRCVTLLLVSLIFLTGLVVGDEPPAPDKGDTPPRLKRKKRDSEPDKETRRQGDKEKEPAKDKAKPKEEEPLVPEDGRAVEEEDDKEVLERISKNMRAVEEKIGNRELGEPTAQQQRDILKDIDSLIKKSEQQSGGGGGADNQPQPQGGEQDKQDQDKQGGAQQKQRQQRMQQGGAGGKQQAKAGGKRPRRQLRSERGGKQRQDRQMAKGNPMGGGQPQMKPGGQGDNPGAGGTGPQSERDINTEMYKDIWGHLPESLRAEMNAYSNPQPFLPRYDRLIREYYKTIAEQGRKKGD